MNELIKANTSAPGSPGAQFSGALAQHPASQPVDLTWLGRVLLKRRLLIALSVFCAVAPTAVFVTVAEPLYRSTVTIQFDPESAKVLPYKDVSDTLANPLPHFELYMKTQQELLKSATLRAVTAERARRELGRFGKAALDGALQKGPQIDRLEGSQVLRISHAAPNPELAAAIANMWADEFISLHGERRQQTGDKASTFLRQQLAKLKQNVEKAEADLIDYARRHEILSIDSRQENVIRQRFGYLSTELSRAEKELIGRNAEFEALAAVSLEEFPDALKSPVIVSLETRVVQAEQDLSRLLSQFDEKWPAVAQKKQELALARGQLQEARRTALARARKQAEMNYSAARNECDMLGNALRNQAGLVNRLNQASVEYNTLKRDFEANEQLYQGLLQRLKETGVSAGLELGNIHIVDRAQPEPEPYRPRKALSLALALILGLSFGIGAGILLESVNRTVSDPWEVEACGVPLLGWIPKLLDGAGRQARKDGAAGLLLAGPTLAQAAGRQSEGLSKAEYRARESYRALCASLLLSQPESPPRAILVTSAAPKEGKTTATASLEIGRASCRGRV